MKVATYDVVPITPALGMLAFVGGTRPLLDVISPDLVDTSGKANDSFYAGIHVCSVITNPDRDYLQAQLTFRPNAAEQAAAL